MANRTDSPTAVKHGYLHNESNGLVYGIGGKRLTDIIGWESTTRGFYGNIESRLSTQNGVQSFDSGALDLREVFRMGKFIFKILSIPPFFDEKLVNVMRFVLEDNVRQVDGLPENALDTISQINGATRIESMFPGGYKQSFTTFSVVTNEYAGGITRKLINYWIRGMSDHETGIGHLYGKNIPFIKSSYSASFIYIILGPLARPEDIEFSCIFHSAWPSKEVGGYLASNTLGESGSVGEITIEFYALYQSSPATDALAKIITMSYHLYDESAHESHLPAELIERYFGGDTSGNYTFGGLDPRMSIATHDRLTKAAAEDPNSNYTTTIMQYLDNCNRMSYGESTESYLSEDYKSIIGKTINYDDSELRDNIFANNY